MVQKGEDLVRFCGADKQIKDFDNVVAKGSGRDSNIALMQNFKLLETNVYLEIKSKDAH